MKSPILFLAVLAATVAIAGDLEAIKAEPNLERKSERALDNANHCITEARDAYAAGKAADARKALDEAIGSVELSYEALSATGKQPRKNPKYFKRAELHLREMLRRLTNLENEFDVADRLAVLKAEERFHQVHDDLLNGIMTRKN